MIGDHGQIKYIKVLKDNIPDFNSKFKVLFTTGDSLARLYACVNNISNICPSTTSNFPSVNYCESNPLGMVYYSENINDEKIFNIDIEKYIEEKIKEYIEIIQEFGVGELLLNSIDRDGLGYGYDYETLKEVRSICDLPIIAAGGADNYIELVKGIESNYLNAVSTSHLFNFIGKGILQTREEMIKMNANIPVRNIYK